MSWSRQLKEASFRGTKFAVAAVDDDLQWRHAEYRFPFRDGANIDSFGRDARVVELDAIFHGDTYASRLAKFIRLCDEQKTGLFVHPILGSWQAKVRALRVRHEHASRDMATVQITVVQDGTATKLPDVQTVAALEDEAEARADEVTTANTKSTKEVTDFVSAAKDFAGKAKTYAAELEAKINQVRKKAEEAVAAVDKLTNFDNYPLVRAIKRCTYSCSKLARRVERLHPRVIREELAAALPLTKLAHRLYGDAGRADEIAERNPIRNTWDVRRGTVVRVYDR